MTDYALPAAGSAQVWIDFDGTISRLDVLDELIAHYAVNETWKLIEERWQSGLIGSRECLRQEFALLDIDDAELERFLDQIQIDPGFVPLLNLLHRQRVPVAILSDGIESFIRKILLRHGVDKIAIRANRITRRNNTLHLVCPHANKQCRSEAAHCKCASARDLGQPARKTIYVGDGRSDLCVAGKADRIFAKAALAKALAAEHIPYITFSSLQDIAAVLERAWSAKVAAL